MVFSLPVLRENIDWLTVEISSILFQNKITRGNKSIITSNKNVPIYSAGHNNISEPGVMKNVNRNMGSLSRFQYFEECYLWHWIKNKI